MKSKNPLLAVTVLTATPITSPALAQEQQGADPISLRGITDALMTSAKAIAVHRDSSGTVDGWQITKEFRSGNVRSTITVGVPLDEKGLDPPSASELAENPRILAENAGSQGSETAIPNGGLADQTVQLPNGAVSNTWTPWFLACANGMVAPPTSGPACNLLTADTLPHGNPNVQIIFLEAGDNSVPLSGATGPNIIDDALQYARFYGIQQGKLANGNYGPNVTIQNADALAPPPNNITTNSDADSAITNASEARMDVEAGMATNPNAARYVVLQFDPDYREPNGENVEMHALDVARQIAAQSPNLLTVVSISQSFGVSYGTDDYTAMQAADDKHFLAADGAPVPGYIVVAASGDSLGYPAYPCSSQYVVCVGGTQINVDKNNNYTGQSMLHTSATSGTAAGVDPSEPTPPFQKSLISSFPVTLAPGIGRLVPDLCYSGSNFSMVLGGHWLTGGGASVAAPLAAGVLSNIPLLGRIGPRGANPQREETVAIGRPSVKSAQSFPSTTDVLEAMYATLSEHSERRLDGDDPARLGRDSPRGRPAIRVPQATQDRLIPDGRKYSSLLSACEFSGVKPQEEIWSSCGSDMRSRLIPIWPTDFQELPRQLWPR